MAAVTDMRIRPAWIIIGCPQPRRTLSRDRRSAARPLVTRVAIAYQKRVPGDTSCDCTRNARTHARQMAANDQADESQRPISFLAMSSATAAGSRPVAALSAQIASSRPGICSTRSRTRPGPPSSRYSTETLMMPPALIT
jgi:hypothetical protein